MKSLTFEPVFSPSRPVGDVSRLLIADAGCCYVLRVLQYYSESPGAWDVLGFNQWSLA